ncbi:MAG: hypothetical protein V1758_13275 [Pseudomonadota bacterium]
MSTIIEASYWIRSRQLDICFTERSVVDVSDNQVWAGADAALGGLAAAMSHDMIFSGPMAGSGKLFPAVATAQTLRKVCPDD